MRTFSRLQKGLSFILVAFLASVSIAFPVYASDKLGPTAILTISPTGGSIYTIFTFDASLSLDGHGFKSNLEYRFNVDHSSSYFTDWSSKSKIDYQYTSFGDKTVILEVRDTESGLTDRTISEIYVDDNLKMGAELFVSPIKGDTNTEFRFEAVVTTDLSTPPSEYEVRFDFDGDNEWDTKFSKGQIAYHAFSHIGYYTPRIEIRDPSGNTIIVTGLAEDIEGAIEDREDMILVSRSGAPQASISAYPGVGVANHTTFYFDATASFDYEDLWDLQYRFDFENDGIFDTEFSTEGQAQTTYATSGRYTAVVQISDSEGMVDEAYTVVEVRERDIPPEADFIVRSDSQLQQRDIGTLATIFRFNAVSSKDIEDSGSKLQVRWDFENDGVWDTTFSTEKSAEHRYFETGVKDVKLQVRDLAGNMSSIIKSISVVENTVPDARLSITPLAGTSATFFTIDPKNTRDEQYQKSYLKVRYDFNSDGKWDTDFASMRSIRKQFSSVGRRIITVQVRDPEGHISTASQEIEIYENSSPQAILEVSPKEGTFSTQFSLDASKSFDPKPSSGQLKYRWDFDYTGESDIQYDSTFTGNSVKKIKFDRVNKTGIVRIRVDVQDEDGLISTSISEINLHWSSQYIDALRRDGVLRGYQNGDMKPDQYVTRAELTKMILEAMDVRSTGSQFSQQFSDVSRKDWFWQYVHKGKELGIVEGYRDGSFRPNQTVTRAEALSLLFKAYEIESQLTASTVYMSSGISIIFPDVPDGQWFSDYVSLASSIGLVKGYDDGYFRPHKQMTRGEAAKVVYMATQKFAF